MNETRTITTNSLGPWTKVTEQFIAEGRWYSTYWLVLSHEDGTFWGWKYSQRKTEVQETVWPWDATNLPLSLVQLYPHEVFSSRTEFHPSPHVLDMPNPLLKENEQLRIENAILRQQLDDVRALKVGQSGEYDRLIDERDKLREMLDLQNDNLHNHLQQVVLEWQNQAPDLDRTPSITELFMWMQSRNSVNRAKCDALLSDVAELRHEADQWQAEYENSAKRAGQLLEETAKAKTLVSAIDDLLYAERCLGEIPVNTDAFFAAEMSRDRAWNKLIDVRHEWLPSYL